MLKNDYLELYLQKSRILSEFEKEIQQDDDNYVLNLSRPLSTDKIKDINNKNLFKFTDDLFYINQLTICYFLQLQIKN